jgi:Na+/proline symporter
MAMMGISLVFYSAISRINGGAITAFRTALDAGRLRILNFSTDPTQLTSLWACLLGGSVLCLASLTIDQAILQRLFTTKSYKDCRRSIILQAVTVVPASLMLCLVGTALFAFYHFHSDHLVGLNSEDAIMPFFAIRELPYGVSGLLVASIFAASMAVMSAGISALTTASTVDIYQRLFRPNETAQHYAAVGRIGTACWGLAATFLALFAKYLGELVNAYNRVSSYICGPLLGIFLLGILTRRTTSGGSLIGAVAGLFLVSWVGLRSQWSFLYLSVIGLVATLIVGYAASLLMEPPPTAQIRGLVMGLEVDEHAVAGQRV